MKREPDFSQLLAVLRKSKPARPVLFEFVVNQEYLRALVESGGGQWRMPDNTPLAILDNWIRGFRAAGYDFATFPNWAANLLSFGRGDRDRLASVGMAHGGVITGRASFERFPWPNPEEGDYAFLEQARPLLPGGMKLILFGPGGVLENLVSLVGYEDLCYLLADDPQLVREITDAIGSRILRHYERALEHDVFGAAFVNDDWGFKTQLFLGPDQLRELIFPWHRRIVEAIHGRGLPAILHSCGNMEAVWEDIITGLRFDGKHSYEDTIQPVEQVYDRFAGRLAIMGGIDLDFLCRETPDAVHRRCRAMLERASAQGGYALGSGNSIPAYVPFDNYNAMRRAALEG